MRAYPPWCVLFFAYVHTGKQVVTIFFMILTILGHKNITASKRTTTVFRSNFDYMIKSSAHIASVSLEIAVPEFDEISKERRSSLTDLLGSLGKLV